MRAALALTVAAAALALSPPANADITVYTAALSGPAEFLPNASPGTGLATVTVDTDALTMRVQASFSGLIGRTIASRIHCCVTDPGGDAGIATTTPSFVGFPLGVRSGTFDNTLSLTDKGSYNLTFILLSSGLTVESAMAELLTGLGNGTAFFNIDTEAFRDGEIRGFLTPAAVAIPEPDTYLLLVAGLGLVGTVGKRRRARS